jgi:two-component sensor histidine kinase
MSLDVSNLTEQKAAGFISMIDDAFCICEIVVDSEGMARDYRVLETNPAFAQVTGLGSAIGRTALELVPTLEPIWVSRCADVALNGRTQRFQDRVEALARDFDVFAAPLDPPGHFALIFRDITLDRRERADHARALERARRMLDELSHRVMNSFSVMSAIVSMEVRNHHDSESLRPLTSLRDRVKALAALYKTLNDAGSVDRMQADLYLRDILAGLQTAMTETQIDFAVRIAPVVLPADTAVPLGLILTELVTNALKYAFAGRSDGRISVDLRREGTEMVLRVGDNGCGIAPGRAGARGPGTGSKLISAFVTQLDGTSETETSARGTTITLRFPAPPAEVAEPALRAPDAG